MAIYHCSVRTFSRSEGHSAVAAAAYRAGEVITDERTGRIHRYANRSGVIDSFILAPHSLSENPFSRAQLWNAAEVAENRKNSRVAREVILALPHELCDKQRADLTKDMALYLIERYRVMVDVAIHAPVSGEGHDDRNHHAHLLFTTREVSSNGFGVKTRVLDDKVTGPTEIDIIRQTWEVLANDALDRAGFPEVTIDRRSLEDQGVDRIPQIHEGKAARNAKGSLVGQAFAKAEQGEDDDDTDTESSGEKSASSGSSSMNVSLNSDINELNKNNIYQYNNEKYSRLTFNEEIKSLNAKRSAFHAKPLPEQIVQMDRLMDRLDKRLSRLERYEQSLRS